MQPSPSPPHSTSGCLLFPAGNSCNGLSLFGGGGEENLLSFIINQQSFKKVLQGKSVSTNFVKIHIYIYIYIYLPGVLKTGLPEILSQVQHIAGNLSKLNLLKALILLV